MPIMTKYKKQIDKYISALTEINEEIQAETEQAHTLKLLQEADVFTNNLQATILKYKISYNLKNNTGEKTNEWCCYIW